MRRPLQLFAPILALAIHCATAAPLAAEETAPPTIGLIQNGVPVPLEARDGAFHAAVSPLGFILTMNPMPESLAITFGREDLFSLADAPATPYTAALQPTLFAPAMAYARYPTPFASFFMTDPACAPPDLGPGYNLLYAQHATLDGYPVAALELDRASEGCSAPDRLPYGENLLGLINPLYMIVRGPNGDTRLVLHFVGS